MTLEAGAGCARLTHTHRRHTRADCWSNSSDCGPCPESGRAVMRSGPEGAGRKLVGGGDCCCWLSAGCERAGPRWLRRNAR